MSKIKNLKLVSYGFILGAMFFGGISYAASEAVRLDAYYGVKIFLNGIDKTPTENKPFIVDGSTYVSLRAVADLLGVPINWDGDYIVVQLGKRIEGTDF
ncbi:copper amine oxidase N-terminal domain-containing protein [Paenibacillus sp. WQ 127069]|uniref:Copper amine oxidase N-terminal domain-containing protein n=1 Tax=Paenibacillus baimaensis TaxID=2982185 RepID=A0ABT2UBW7_9BACL|nr:copper amine oxidase N-terminal domain-containing protein [Paenibacillus sp. WQ 127069]MCU6792100.1 copper amine oxidase N-terminal domain-containing protein [Paenibacillus sp. WQ 127069]